MRGLLLNKYLCCNNIYLSVIIFQLRTSFTVVEMLMRDRDNLELNHLIWKF